jgi:hypothetical protein
MTVRRRGSFFAGFPWSFTRETAIRIRSEIQQPVSFSLANDSSHRESGGESGSAQPPEGKP